MSTAPVDLRRSAQHRSPKLTAALAGERYEHLRKIGFPQEAADKIFEAIDLPSQEVIDTKISDLQALGFADPVKMITSLPAILGYAIDNIRGKISDLQALGFADPVKMITSLPAILGLAIDNIRGKISDLQALGFADPVKMITSSPVLLSYSRERLLTCARLVCGLDGYQHRHLISLIVKPKGVIAAVVAAAPTTWREVLDAAKAEKEKVCK